jgi:hypothetical protein
MDFPEGEQFTVPWVSLNAVKSCVEPPKQVGAL